jgi:chitodextrinase
MRKKKSRDAFVTITVCGLVLFAAVFFCMSTVRAAGPTPVNVTPASQTVNASKTFVVTIACTPQKPVKAFELKLSYNPSFVRATSVSEGDFFDGYTTFFNPGVIDNTAGRILNIYNLIVGPGNVTGAGSLVIINFTARSTSGTSTLSLYDVRLTNESAYLSISVVSGGVTVTGGSSPPVNPPPSEPPENPPAEGNTPPNAPLKPVGPTLVEAGAMYQYNSSAVDPDGDQVRLRFDWGDGSLSTWSDFVASNTSVSASHAWTNVSNYPVRVIAQDTNGSNSSWSETLTVMISQFGSEGFPPVGMFHIPANASVNHSMVFDASGSFDPDGTIVSYVWDFGDGITGVGAIVVHTYESPGEYTVTLTVTDNAGLNYNYSQVVSITDSSQASTGSGAGLLPPNEMMILFVALVVAGLIILFVYRYRTREVTLQKHIKTSKQRLALMDQDTADIDQIVDALFAEVKQRKQTPRTDMMLDAYNDLIVGRVEKNPAIAIPSISMDAVENLVDRRVHALIVEKLDKM